MSDGNEPEDGCAYLLKIYVGIRNRKLLFNTHTGFDA
jgi:hypothetical protein